MPLGATVAAKHIFDSVERSGVGLMHGHTFSGNPLAMAACRAMLSQVASGESDVVALHLANAATNYIGKVRRSRVLGFPKQCWGLILILNSKT